MHFPSNYPASSWSSCKLPIHDKLWQGIPQLWSVAQKMASLLLLSLSPVTLIWFLKIFFVQKMMNSFSLSSLSSLILCFFSPLFSPHLILKVILSTEVVPRPLLIFVVLLWTFFPFQYIHFEVKGRNSPEVKVTKLFSSFFSSNNSCFQLCSPITTKFYVYL